MKKLVLLILVLMLSACAKAETPVKVTAEETPAPTKVTAEETPEYVGVFTGRGLLGGRDGTYKLDIQADGTITGHVSGGGINDGTGEDDFTQTYTTEEVSVGTYIKSSGTYEVNLIYTAEGKLYWLMDNADGENTFTDGSGSSHSYPIDVPDAEFTKE
ncbi:hypothetical protein AGMMS49975_24870 [Clostridia bacterium]|nr:hypothetical protein AGMMS49975_24870 [Clostridia bacterium]